MRIIHTADWHLCDKLGRLDRTADLRSRVERVAALCDEHAADVLLVAGDLFSEHATVDQMADSLRHLNATFAGFFARGGTVLAITGNHDHDGRINLARSGMTLADPAADPGRLLPGRMHLVNGLRFTALEARPGDRVQFALMPYPNQARYLLPTDVYRSREEVNRLLQTRAAEWLEGQPGEPGFDPTLPTVLAAHFHVTGAEVNGRYKISERDDVDFAPAALPTAWAYVALGHVHKPQCLGGMPHVRYPGPLDRLDFGEREYDCGVVLVDVGPAGLVGEPVCLPLDATPFRVIDLCDPDATLAGLADAHPDRDRAIVTVTAAPSDTHGRDDISREVRRLFPRLYHLGWADAAPPAGTTTAERTEGYAPGADPRETVRRYLEAEVAADDPDRAELLELAETFLMSEAGS